MKKQWITMIAVTAMASVALETHASIIFDVTPDDVNRLNEFVPDDTDDVFSTRQQVGVNSQYTILTTSQSTFLTQLGIELGVLGAGEFYQINSATLTVGSAADEYETASNAHQMLTTYDVGDASWNNSDESAGTLWAGGTIAESGGTDWASATLATGVIGTDVTTFDLTAYVQGVVDGTISGAGEGLFFENIGGGAGPSTFETAGANVVWTLDAQVVPEPATMSMLGLGALVTLIIRRRLAA